MQPRSNAAHVLSFGVTVGLKRVVIHRLEHFLHAFFVAEVFKRHTLGRFGRVGIIRVEVLLPEFRRIHAEDFGGLIHQAFGHRAFDGVADCPAALLSVHFAHTEATVCSGGGRL